MKRIKCLLNFHNYYTASKVVVSKSGNKEFKDVKVCIDCGKEK